MDFQNTDVRPAPRNTVVRQAHQASGDSQRQRKAFVHARAVLVAKSRPKSASDDAQSNEPVTETNQAAEETLQLGTLRRTCPEGHYGPDFKLSMTLVDEAEHIAYIRVEFAATWLGSDSIQQYSERGAMYFTLSNLRQPPTCLPQTEVTDPTFDPALFELVEDHEHLAVTTLQFSGAIYALNFLASNNWGSGPWKANIVTLRSWFEEGREVDLHLLTCDNVWQEQFNLFMPSLMSTARHLINGKWQYPMLAKYYNDQVVNPQQGQWNEEAIWGDAYSTDYAHPPERVVTRHSYFNLEEFVTVHGMGVQIELANEKSESHAVTTCSARFMELHGQPLAYWVFLNVSGNNATETAVRLAPGDQIRLCIDTGSNVRSHDWPGIVMEHPPFAPANSVSVILLRPYIEVHQANNDNETVSEAENVTESGTTEPEAETQSKTEHGENHKDVASDNEKVSESKTVTESGATEPKAETKPKTEPETQSKTEHGENQKDVASDNEKVSESKTVTESGATEPEAETKPKTEPETQSKTEHGENQTDLASDNVDSARHGPGSEATVSQPEQDEFQEEHDGDGLPTRRNQVEVVNRQWAELMPPSEALLPVQEQGTYEDVRRAVSNLLEVKVYVRKEVSLKTTKLLVTALHDAWVNRDIIHHPIVKPMLANAPSMMPNCGILNFLNSCGLAKSKVQEILHKASTGLNVEQQKGLRQILSNQTGPIRVINGPAGTGKSHFLRSLCGIAGEMNLSNSNPEKRIRVLVLAPSNDLVNKIADDLAQDFSKLSAEHEDTPPLVVIRQHTRNTEKAFALLQTNNAVNADATPSEGDRNITVRPNDFAFCAELLAARDSITRLSQEIARPVQGIKDKRAVKTNWSLGTRIASLCGLLPDSKEEHKRSDQCFRDFASFNQAMLDGSFNPENTAKRTEAFAECEKLVLSSDADVVVTTVTNATTHHVQNFAPHIIMYDEASRLSDAQYLATASRNGQSARFFIVCGDEHQLPPFSGVESMQFKYGNLYNRSVLSRFAMAGIPEVRFVKQMRFSHDICELVNHLRYIDLQQRGDEDDTAGAHLQAVSAMAAIGVKHSHTLALVPVETGKAVRMINAGESSYNISNMETTINIIANWLLNGVPASEIGIVTPYKAQNDMYFTAMTILAEYLNTASAPGSHSTGPANPIDTSAIGINTADTMQGLERSMLVFDTVITDKMGHVKDDKRVISAITRGMNAMVIIGAPDNLHNMHQGQSRNNIGRWNRSLINKTFEYCKLRRLVVSEPQTRNVWRDSGMATVFSEDALSQEQNFSDSWIIVDGHRYNLVDRNESSNDATEQDGTQDDDDAWS